MKARRISALLAAAFLSLAILAGCSPDKSESSATSDSTSKPAEKTKINVAVIKGPSGIGMVNLMEANANGTTSNKYDFTVVSSPDEIVSKISSGAVDLATPPTNMASALYKRTGGNVQMLAASTKGVLYILENGNTVKKVSDLKGKTIYATGQGANPEFVLNYILTKNGLDPKKDVNIEFRTENDELSALLANGTAKIALVPEPIVTAVKAKKPELQVALNMTNEWDAVSGGESQLLMGCVIGRKEFVSQNPDAIEAFLAEYKTSIEKATSNIDASASLCETYEIIPKAAVAKAAIPRSGLTYIDGNDMMKQIKGYFEVLFAAEPKSVGGALPDDAFYYNAK
ncbi:MAG TPA: hypothetical protein DEB10_06830 [Ruminococcaceae bacterium]|nr:hypothetical protein [Oscillospiraceae bacterium]